MPTAPQHFRPRLCAALTLAIAFCLLTACARPVQRQESGPFTLTIAHVNDTHSNLEPVDTGLTLAGVKVTGQLGGFARLKTALDEVRASEEHVLALHAGDAVQGTLFFNVFQGKADFDFLNQLGLDAMTLGNHEFDKGPALTGSLVDQARFPVVSANSTSRASLPWRASSGPTWSGCTGESAWASSASPRPARRRSPATWAG